MEQKHDRSYHRLFSEPELLEDLVRNFVDESWVNELDFAKMVRVNAKFHSEALERRDGDIIVRIPFLKEQQREIYLYLLLEFQSTIDEWMALRFGTYVHLLYEQITKEGRLAPDGRLPPVFPLVLYNGDKHWDAALDLKSLISLPPNTPLWQWQPNMRYYLVDESRYPEGKPGSLSGFVFRLENAKSPQDFKAALEEMVQAIPSHLDSVKRAFAVWITYVLAPHKGIQLKPRDIDNLDEVNDMLSTRIEQWEIDIREEGREKGMEEGIEKGMEKGMEKGEATLLSRQLELKFGPLPEWVQEKISSADKNALEDWGLRLINANSLENVFK
ncbi:MAG: DUF4351 domain-containing protein [Gammaproteobacteria bacterium]|nr:DUF4351 domain-containing protein [Gammaproteobacteria bacterium]